MTKAKRYDTAVLTEDIGAFQKGEKGAVVEVYTTPYEAYDIEIVTDEGKTKGLVEAVRPEQIEVVRERQMIEKHSCKLEEYQAVILFADIVDSTAMAEELNLHDYVEIVGQLQTIAKELDEELKRQNAKFDISARGDEICLILRAELSNANQHLLNVQRALQAACELKLRWLLTRYNEDRVKDGRLPRDLAIGIHCGRILYGPHPFKAPDPTPEGFAISVAKRVESEARKGTFSRIFMSDSMKRQVEDYCRRTRWDLPAIDHRGALQEAKGLPAGRYHVHELRAVGDVPFIIDPERTSVDSERISTLLNKVFCCYERMAREYPHETWLCALVAILYRECAHYEHNKCKNLNKAEEYYGRGIDLFREWWRLWNDWGQLYLLQEKRDPSKAIPKFRRACEYGPRAITPRRNLVNALLFAGRKDKAIEVARDALWEVPCEVEELQRPPRWPTGYEAHPDFCDVLNKAATWET